MKHIGLERAFFHSNQHTFNKMLQESIKMQENKSQRWTWPRFDLFDYIVAEVD